MTLTITIIIIAITCIISFMAFSNQRLIDDFIFYPPAITQRQQWYRFITCGFIHADIMHLAFNMISLYMFGQIVEKMFDRFLFPGYGKTMFILFYLSALAISLLPTYSQHKDNYYYRSLGASGATSAVVFAGIFLFPTEEIGIFIIPPIIPGFIFAPLFLFISARLEKRGDDNINHSAHIWGSVYGIVFLIISCTFFSTYKPLQSFINQVVRYFQDLFK